MNRLTTGTDSLGNQSQYEYDTNNNLTAQIDPNNNRVEYAYDALDRRDQHTQLKDSGNLVVSYAYDANDNLVEQTDSKGQVFTYVYDALDRETERNDPSGTDLLASSNSPYLDPVQTTRAYDANNNLTQISETKADSGGSNQTDVISHQYDRLDRLTQKTERGQVITYTYDDNGNKTSLSTGSNSTTYAYDSRNRLTSLTEGSNVTTYTYTPDSLIDVTVFPNGTQSDQDYDNADRVTDIQHRITASSQLFTRYQYQYDANGNRSQQIETQTGFNGTGISETATTTYQYDGADRLTTTNIQAGGTTTQTTFTYDAAGNRLTETEVENASTQYTKTYSYDQTHWLTQVTINNVPSPGGEGQGEGDIDLSYDANGNTTRKVDNTQTPVEQTDFSYDSRDQLVQVIRGPPASQTALGLYDYDYRGLRIRQTNTERGDVHTRYDDRSILEERNLNSNDLIAHYRYGLRQHSLSTDSTTQYYHQASLGTTATLTNQSGTIDTAYRTDAFGEITEQEGESNTQNRQVFTGKEHDQTGLVYFGARYYDPQLGRFITQDTYLGDPNTPPSLHRYLYAYANPTVYIDVDGHAAYLASGKEFDQLGYQLYRKGNKVGAFAVAVLGATYKAGTGFFTLGLFDEANQAITDTDTYSDAAKQFGSSIKQTAIDTAKEYAEEGVIAGTSAVAGKLACGRWRQACDSAIDVAKKVGDKLDTDVRDLVRKKQGKADHQPSLTYEKQAGPTAGSQQQADTKSSADSQSDAVQYYRVEGGGQRNATSRNRVTVNDDRSISIDSSCPGQLCVSAEAPDHARYFLQNRREGGSVIVFDVNRKTHDQIMSESVDQDLAQFNPGAPKRVDETKPGTSLELPKKWDRVLEENSSNARVLSQEEFLKEYGE